MQLESKNCRLVLSIPDDPELNSLISDKEALNNLSETRLYAGPMPDQYIFRIEKGGLLIGEIRLQRIKWINRKAEVSLVISKPHRSKGFGKNVLITLMNFAFNRINLHRLEAEVFDYNSAAKKLFIDAGFKEEGCLREARYFNGKYFDIIRYGLLKSEFSQ
jgi:RimJ/RimL family protein N-acetyltransferase